MIDGTSGLDPAIVPSPDDGAFVNQYGADGDASLGKAFARLFERRRQERVLGRHNDVW